MSKDAEHPLEAGHTTLEAKNVHTPMEDSWSVSNGPKDASPGDDRKPGASDTAEAASHPDVIGALATEASPFPGYVQTEFSSAKKQYFYMDSKEKSREGSGNYAVVHKVYWHNPETGLLEACVAKSLEVVKGQMHPDGSAGWHADAAGEMAALRRLAGVPGVPGFRDLLTGPDGAIHIVMEYAPGHDLSIRMGFRDLPWMGLSWQQMRSTLRHLAQVLADCHDRGVVHGDIKPHNIMTVQEGCQVTLVDFGSASLWDGSGWKYNGGTFAYTAPELLSSARSKPAADAPPCFRLHGPPVDCWAYGVVAMELLTGCCLFGTNTRARPSKIVPGSEECQLWDMRYTADLHGQWEEQLESSPVVATFRRRLELLGSASEEYKRAATDFLHGLLEANPGKRMTAPDALFHRFLTDDFPEVAPDLMPGVIEEDRPVIETTMDRILWEMTQNICTEE